MGRAAEIWLLGGTGDVGRRLAARLVADMGGAQIVLASRSAGSSGGDLTRKIGPNVRAVVLDVKDPAAASRIPPGAIVVNLTEVTPPALAQAIVAKGGGFIESAASPAYLSDLKAALSLKGATGRAVLYAGVSPGLTNLAAAALHQAAPETRRIDLTIEMGLGRHYGKAATEWFLAAAGLSYPAIIKGVTKTLSPGEFTQMVQFDGDPKPRLALSYGFAEQVEIAKVLPMETVRNFIALDPPWVTRALRRAISLGLGSVLANNPALFARLMAKGPGMGVMRTRLIAEGRDETGELSARIDVVTGDQAEATATILATVVRAVQNKSRAPLSGATEDITDVLSFETAIRALTKVMPETKALTSWQHDAGGEMRRAAGE